jgi:hypothetical protein
VLVWVLQRNKTNMILEKANMKKRKKDRGGGQEKEREINN